MTREEILTKLNTPGIFSTPKEVTEFFEQALEQYAREKQLEVLHELLNEYPADCHSSEMGTTFQFPILETIKEIEALTKGE